MVQGSVLASEVTGAAACALACPSPVEAEKAG
jgi:hypothetical protein